MIPSSIQFKHPPFRLVQGKPLFIAEGEYREVVADFTASDFIVRLKTFFRGFSRLYGIIFYVLAPALFLGKGPKSIYKFVPAGGLVAEVGSGNHRLDPNIMNVDVHPWENVDILADAHDLPFGDGSLDGIVCAWVLEHLRDPVRAVEEFRRTLKADGVLYLSTNFIMPHHPSPHDYYRWTAEGLKELFSDWKIVELKPIIGPTCALLFIVQEWLAIALSFNIRPLKDFLWIILTILTFPIKIFDLLLIRYRTAEVITTGFYVIARKRS